MGLLEGKVALVTGAAMGLGRETAELFAREGARVVAADIEVEAGEETAERVRKAGGDARFVEVDLRQAAQVETMVARAVDAYGQLDCAVNNAALSSGYARTADLGLEHWDRTLAVTLTGVFLCMKYEIPALLEAGGGSIVNVASVSAIKGEAFLSAYSAAKGGVISLTKTAASEYAQQGVRINALCPGGILTPGLQEYFRRDPSAEAPAVENHAMKRMAQPVEIANALAWLCSERASFVTGSVQVADGGSLVRSHVL